MKTPSPPLPFVTVIIPVHNDPQGIQASLKELKAQTYPQERFEVLVVDNRSDPPLPPTLADGNATILQENHTQGSYAARNRAIQQAQGDILAFTDADCRLTPQWLHEGVRALVDQKADLAGGHVRFTFSKKKSAAQAYDSVSNMQIEQNIRERSVAKTANLFARRPLFDQVGLFPAHLRSGGDVVWTQRATDQGHRLVYAPSAIVEHPTRSLIPLLKKQYRVGKGQGAFCKTDNTGPGIMSRIAFGCLPPLLIRKKIKQLRQQGFSGMLFVIRLWCVAYLLKLTTTTGLIAGWTRPGRPKQDSARRDQGVPAS